RRLQHHVRGGGGADAGDRRQARGGREAALHPGPVPDRDAHPDRGRRRARLPDHARRDGRLPGRARRVRGHAPRLADRHPHHGHAPRPHRDGRGLVPRPPGVDARPRGRAEAVMSTVVSATEVAMVWRLFRADAAHNRKRIALTVLAIAWGTLSIVMLLSFGEGMKRSFHRNTRGMGEDIGVLWAGATTKPYAGLPSGRTLQFTDEDAEI